MKKLDVSELVVGKMYSVGVKGSVFPKANLVYVGIQSYRGTRPEYWFTYGEAENWKRQFNCAATKSRLDITEVK